MVDEIAEYDQGVGSEAPLRASMVSVPDISVARFTFFNERSFTSSNYY